MRLPILPVAGLCCVIGLLAGCHQPLQRSELMTWDVAGQNDVLPLESGQIVVSSSDHTLDLFATLLPEKYNPYIHAAVLSIEDGRPYIYEEYGQQWLNPFVDSPTDAVHGRVRRVPLREFLARYDHIEIWQAGDYDESAIAAFARRHYALKTPFDPYFDHADAEQMYCTEFVALAIQAGGAEKFLPVPNRKNNSARIVLDWLKVPEELIQADTLVTSGQRIATLSLSRSMTEIRVMDEVKQELYRRFTCDQKVGNLFNVTGPSILIREPVQAFIAAAMSLYPAGQPAPDPETIHADVSALALTKFGPYSAADDCP